MGCDLRSRDDVDIDPIAAIRVPLLYHTLFDLPNRHASTQRSVAVSGTALLHSHQCGDSLDVPQQTLPVGPSGRRSAIHVVENILPLLVQRKKKCHFRSPHWGNRMKVMIHSMKRPKKAL